MRKPVLTILLIIVLLIGSFSRLSIAGWFFIVGVLSVIIFGIIHVILHSNLIKYASDLRRADLIFVGISHILYLNLFLFQSDGGDDRAYIVVEYIFGKLKSFELERYVSSIFTVSLIAYFIIAAILLLRLRRINSAFSKKKLKLVILSILLVIILPIGFLYVSSKLRDLKEMKADEKLGKYESLGRALKNKENVKYLRLYKCPDSYTSIPKAVFKLYNLEELEMYSNKIEEIPKEISLLKKLKILDLQYNQIKTIPNEIADLENIEEITFMNNYIDSINPKICDCLKLKKLSISGKSLKSIPACLSRMASLERLVVQTDSINNIVDDLEAFIYLKELDIFTYGSTLRDHNKLLELKKKLLNTKTNIPSSFSDE